MQREYVLQGNPTAEYRIPTIFKSNNVYLSPSCGHLSGLEVEEVYLASFEIFLDFPCDIFCPEPE